MDALNVMVERKMLAESALKQMVASVSVGVFQGQPVLDLDYAEDSNADTDMNVVMTENGGFIELQGTGEDGEFTHDQLSAMVALAEAGIKQLLAIQQASLA